MTSHYNPKSVPHIIERTLTNMAVILRDKTVYDAGTKEERTSWVFEDRKSRPIQVLRMGLTTHVYIPKERTLTFVRGQTKQLVAALKALG